MSLKSELESNVGQGRVAVVVGAGPSGCLAAMLLLRQGWTVHVIEMRDKDASIGSVSKQRSWPIGMFPRGINAVLKAVPDATDFFESRTYHSMVFHKNDGTVTFKIDRWQFGASLVHRTEAAALLTKAMLKYEDLISIHYSTCFTGADFYEKVARFQVQGSDEPLVLNYDVLIGADGAMSGVRSALIDCFPTSIHLKLLLRTDNRVYRAFYGMPKDPQALTWEPAGRQGPATDGHWPAAGNPAEPGICFLPMPGKKPGINVAVSYDVESGTYGGFVPMVEAAAGQLPETVEGWTTWVEENLHPPVPQSWVKPLAAQLDTSPVNRFPWVQRASTMYIPGTSTVLIGDAAHTVTPALGQGLNSALEDAVLVADSLASEPGNVEAALHCFNKARFPQIKALQELELGFRASAEPLFSFARLFASIWPSKAIDTNIFGATDVGVWPRLRVKAYTHTKYAISSVLYAVLGKKRTEAMLPLFFHGPSMIEVQVGAIDYINMIRILDAMGVLASSGATLGAVGLFVLGRSLVAAARK
ncbi:hypothetical protein CEUSTIGMA_g11562.t1 [Chlamydomonas eustigma]|uniref:FAD-binding domain-containing protein n=1 Tax=Chlamydomonas eustigma TaxID=1157962 RepID=A0A250XMI6_9CHLO|nr:hypothetical protein CEUSTIGMA_g11562.t1 [Chlamydomonas eustigma]|eukprot:GAX84139.1 hypothetical protein CEUSTIGMA_g11562.t1 [Chlamydomonas eustigma]